MSGVTVDASVWVAAADASDPFCIQSRTLFSFAIQQGAQLSIPTFAIAEVACALARRRRDAALARRLTSLMLAPDHVVHMPVNARLIAHSVLLGTDSFLRGADALYAAAAQFAGATLVSWDDELIQRAGALTPAAWLAANPPSP